MYYRLSGVHHSRYESARALWPVPADRTIVILLLLLALAAPLYLSDLYLGSYMLPWVIWSAAALSLTLLMGLAGQLHFGFAAVMAIGAYAAIHIVRAGVPFEIALLAAGIVAAVIGTVFGAAALRVKGLYLVMATLAMQYLVDWVIVNVPAISGGAHATLRTPEVRFLFMPIESLASRYWLALGWVVLMTLFFLNVKRTSFGRALVAIRDKDFAAAVIGVDPFRYKLMAFFTSSFMGGVTGAILAFCYYRAVTPGTVRLQRFHPARRDGAGRRSRLCHRVVSGGGFRAACAHRADECHRRSGRGGVGSGQPELHLASAAHDLWRDDYRISAVRAAGAGKDLRQHPQVFPGLAIPPRQELTS